MCDPWGVPFTSPLTFKWRMLINNFHEKLFLNFPHIIPHGTPTELKSG